MGAPDASTRCVIGRRGSVGVARAYARERSPLLSGGVCRVCCEKGGTRGRCGGRALFVSVAAAATLLYSAPPHCQAPSQASLGRLARGVGTVVAQRQEERRGWATGVGSAPQGED